MGYRVSWLAVRGLPKDNLLAALGMTDSGEKDEANEAPFSAAALPTGWTMLWANDPDHAGDALAARLSAAHGTVIAVRVDETCMHSTAVLFEAGRQRWRLHHEGDERIDFLEAQGDLPPAAATTEARLRACQAAEGGEAAEVDHLFDVPLEVARTECGFRHDLSRFDWGEAAFTTVISANGSARRRGWLATLLGR